VGKQRHEQQQVDREAPAASEAEPAVQQRGEDYNTPLIIIYGMIFAVLIFVAVVVMNGFFHQMQSAEQHRKYYAQQPQELLDIRSQQQLRLEGYSWVDQPGGMVRIPIERAMQLTAAELAAQQRAAATKPAAAAAGSGQVR